ncbi:MAG: TIGR02996 domain-containing protein, partial [Myxococcales bacterium]|nr:TIGR02996 domain-containing protein [Myxococcales bacterium]
MAPGQPTPSDTLEHLLQLWRASKHPRLAELIAAFARAHESREAQAWRDSDKLGAAEWTAALAEVDLLDLGALLSVLGKGTAGVVANRISLLAQLEPDPRIADALHALIEARAWTSTGARKVWTRTTSLLAALADPRTRALVDTYAHEGAAGDSRGFAAWMHERLQTLAPKLPEPGPLDAETDALIERLLAGLAGPARSSAGDSLPELLAHSLARPDDLDARLVLADALIELGDARGEFIQVQIARESAPKDRKLAAREKQLLADHRDRFLGPLEPIVRKGSLEFARGFVSACELTDNVYAHLLESVLADEALGNIRSASGPLAFLLAPKLANLRHARVHEREFPST